MTAPLPVLILKTGRYAIHHGGLGIIRSLGRLGVPVYSISEDHITPAAVSRYLARTFVWNTDDLPKSRMLEALSKIGRDLDKPTILIPTDDLGAILIAEESAMLRPWFVFPNISAGTPRRLANKGTLYALCRQMGIACPNTLVPTSLTDVKEFAETARFPLVVKAAAAWLDSKLKVSIVHTERELVDAWHRVESSSNSNLLIQDYIPQGEDWFFHGYCNAVSDCLAGFTGLKIRSFPPNAGITTLGKSVTNDALRHQAEIFLKAISYAGVMDIDYRFDKRDGQYKLLDFNPRVGAQFRVFVDENGVDVVRALYRDLTEQKVQRSRQVDGRIFIVEPFDVRSCAVHFWRGELSLDDWLRSFKGRKEFAWFSWDDPLPFLVVWIRLAVRGVAKMIRNGPFKSRSAAGLGGRGSKMQAGPGDAHRVIGLWSRSDRSRQSSGISEFDRDLSDTFERFGGTEMRQLVRVGVMHGIKWTGLMPIIRRLFAGRAIILMFHEVQRDFRHELMTGTSVELFRQCLASLQRQGWKIVSLEECLSELSKNEPKAPRYAVITFDDGYRDISSAALAILEQHKAPFMVYVPTGAPTRTMNSWWLGLREIFRRTEHVTIDPMGAKFHCSDFLSKKAGLKAVTKWVHDDYRRAALLDPTFHRYGISLSALNDAYFLDERELQELSRHPLASIGAHTTSHAALATLDPSSSRAEMEDNRNYLETLLERPIRHLAYPYGAAGACGPREEGLAEQVGFLSAVTSRKGCLDGGSLNRFGLPRFGVGCHLEARASFEANVSGVYAAGQALKRVVSMPHQMGRSQDHAACS